MQKQKISKRWPVVDNTKLSGIQRTRAHPSLILYERRGLFLWFYYENYKEFARN